MKNLVRFTLLSAFLTCLASGSRLEAQQWSRSLPDSPAMEFIYYPLLVDWDNDGKMEVITLTSNVVQVLNGANGSVMWEMAINLPDTKWAISGLYGFMHSDLNRQAPDDFDGNGKTDFVVSIRSSSSGPVTNLLRLYEISTKALKWEQDVSPYAPNGYAFPMLGQLDSDAAREVVLFNTGSYDWTTGIYTNRGVFVLDGLHGALQWSLALSNSPVFSQYPELVDWNSDGKEELMLLTGGLLEVFSGVNGNSIFAMNLTLPGDGSYVYGPFGFKPANTRMQVPTDLDGNGSKDLLFTVNYDDWMAGIFTNIIQLYEISGAGGSLKWQLPGTENMRPYMVPVANLDADSAREFVVVNGSYDGNSQSYTGQTVTVFSALGGTVQWTRSLPDSASWAQPEVADWDRNGQIDVGVRLGNTLMAFNGANGSPQFDFTVPLPGAAWELNFLGGLIWADLERMVPADFNGDNTPDFYAVLSAFDPMNGTTNLIRLYNLATKNLIWESDPILNFTQIEPEDGNTDADARREIAFVTGLGSHHSGIISNRMVTVLDGASSGQPPSITTHPQSQNVSAGADVTFAVVAAGKAPLQYQWRFNGVNIPGATGSSLLIPHAQAADAGKYSVVVSNAFGHATSSNATLVVAAPPQITDQPDSNSVGPGARVQFDVTAAGTTPLGYQWRFNGTNLRSNARITGATTRALVITTAQIGDAGHYDVVVSNVLGSVTSLVAHLSVCGFTVTPRQVTVPASGGETNVVIAAGGADCDWYTQSTNTWLFVHPPQGRGSGNAMVFVEPNPGPGPRSGRVVVAGQVIQITQLEPPGTLQFSMDNYPVGESAGFARVTIVRSNGAGGTVSVNLWTKELSATDGADFRGTNRVVTFGPGVKSQSIVIPILSDYFDETNEVFAVSLGNPTGGAGIGARDDATVTITDNDSGGGVRFSLRAFSASEAGRVALVTVSRAGGLAAGVTVEAMTHDGSAKAGEDYTAVVTNVTFGANQTVRTFTVPILNDSIDETNETFGVMLGVPTGGATNTVPAEAVVTIVDDDVGGAFAFAKSSYLVGETNGAVIVTVARTGGSAGEVSVELVTSNLTATADADYVGTNIVLHFVAGQRSTNVAIAILDDLIGEDTEKFTAHLRNPTGRAVLGAVKTTTVSVIENETVLQFSLADYPRTENGGAATITVTRTGPSKGTNTVGFATADGSALAGQDYRGTNGVLTFKPGVAFRTFTVPIINDTQVETNEVLLLQLFNPTGGAVLGTRSTTTVTIRSEDR